MSHPPPRRVPSYLGSSFAFTAAVNAATGYSGRGANPHVDVALGAGDFSVRIGRFSLGGIGTATFGAIVLYQLLRERAPQPEEGVVADSAVGAGREDR